MAAAAYKKATRRSGKAWTGADVMRLERMAEKQIPAEQIARRLRRTEGAVRAEAARHQIMLAPRQRTLTGKLPYGGIRVDARRPASRPPRRQAAKNPQPAPPQSETLF